MKMLRSIRYLLPLLAWAVLLSVPGAGPQRVNAQPDNKNVQWKLLTPSVTAAPGKTAIVKVQAVIAPKSHLYTAKTYPADKEGPQATEVTAGEPALLTVAGSLTGNTAPHKKFDSSFSLITEFWEGTVVLNVPVRVAKDAATGKAEGWVSFYFMTCDDKACMPPTDKKFTFSLNVTAPDTAARSRKDSLEGARLEAKRVHDSLVAAAQMAKDTARHDTSAAPAAAPGQDTAATATAPPATDTAKTPVKAAAATTGIADDDVTKARKEGLWAFLLLCMGAGLGSVFLPCVYPIIPITISFFTKRNHATHMHAVKDAFFYAVGIILTFTVVGVPASIIFGPEALNAFIAHPLVSIAIAVLFIVLALSLFGLFEIQLPASIVNALNRKANEKGDSPVGVTLMGIVFALTSFSCTGPIVISLLTQTTKGAWTWPLLGLTAYAAMFSLPFILFALFPTMLKSLMKPGGWMNSIKIVLGFLEIAAAIKYLSSADLIWEKGILTREVVLAIWITISFIIGGYLLGRFRFSHDTPVEHVGIPRTFFATGFLSLALWMTTGLFGGRLGELDAILPPQIYPGKGNTSILAGLRGGGQGETAMNTIPGLDPGVKVEEGWIIDNLEAGIKVARAQKKNVFIDFTGYQCTNCRWMEQNMFPKEQVKGLVNKFVLVRLYTDRRDDINQRNRKMEYDRFGTIAMPYYAIVNPDNQVLSTIAFTRDEDEFTAFLKKGLEPVKVASLR